MPQITDSRLLHDVERCLVTEGTSAAALHTLLDQILTGFDCAVGTLHGFDASSGVLRLRAQRGLPDTLLPRVQTIPIGKGMAGLAAERRAPVQICNLQTDASGAAKPAAKETGMEGSVAVPMLCGERVHGVLGVAKPAAGAFSDEQIATLLQIASIIGRFLDSP